MPVVIGGLDLVDDINETSRLLARQELKILAELSEGALTKNERRCRLTFCMIF